LIGDIAHRFLFCVLASALLRNNPRSVMAVA
jgi:hypothetical protein